MLASLGYESSKTGYCITFDLDHLAMVVNSITDIRYDVMICLIHTLV